jgi:YVTN family beta-propeller protein
MIIKRRVLYVGIILIFALLIPMSIASATPFAYITNSGDNTVSVVDTATNLVIKTVNVGNEPNGVAVSPDGMKAYVANSGSNDISVIDTNTNAVTANLTIGKTSQGISINPAGTKVYVTNTGSGLLSQGTVSVIDIATNNITYVNVGGKNPTGIVCSPDGNKAYVAVTDDNNISIIDTGTNTVIDNVHVLVRPQGIAVSPDGKWLYVTCLIQGAPNFYVIDPATKTVVTSFIVGDNPFAVTVNPTGTKVYTASYNASDFSNDVYVINTISNNITAIVKVGEKIPIGGSTVYPPYGIAFTPDGLKVYVANYNDNNVSVLDTATNNVTTTVNVGKGPKALGQFIVPPAPLIFPDVNFSSNVTSGYAPLAVQFTDLSKNATRLIWNFGDGITSLEQNPIHTYSEAGDYEVTLIVTNGGNQSTKEMKIHVATASPTFAYITNKGTSEVPGNTVSVIDTSANKINTTIKVGQSPYGVAVSPDRKKAYVANSGSDNISIIDTNTNVVTDTINLIKLLLLTYIEPRGIAFNPAGTKVYVTNYKAGSVTIIDPAINYSNVPLGSGTTVNVGTEPIGVVVSPDGRKVYVANWGSHDVSVIDSATNNVTATVNVGPRPQGIAISPDGKNVYVTCYVYYAPNFYIIDTQTNNITSTSIGSLPFGVAVNPDGTKVYTVSWATSPGDYVGTCNLYEYDTTSKSVTDTIKLGGLYAAGVAVHPDGTKVYAVEQKDNTVYVVNTTTKNVTAIVNVGNTPMALGQFIGSSSPSSNPLSSDNNLSALSISNGNLTPTFSPDTLDYTDGVDNNVSSITITPTTEDITATITVNGTAVLSRQTSQPINLLVGANNIPVIITAQNGASKTYTITVTRAAPLSNDDDLSALRISNGTLIPTFSPGTLAYTDNVDNSVSSVTVTPTAEDMNSTITVNGTAVLSGQASQPINLNVGTNNIPVIVTTQNGTSKTYVITVTRAAPLPIAGALPFAYITNYGANTISVINTSTNKITTTVSSLNHAWGVAVNPAGTNVYVTDRNGNKVSKISTDTNTIVARINVGNGPFGVAVNNEDTKAYVTNYIDGTVSIIDTATNEIKATVNVGWNLTGVAVTPDDKIAYVALSMPNTVNGIVSVINTTTNTVVAKVVVGANPYGIAVTPNGKEVYVANSKDGTVSVIDTATNTVKATLRVGNSPTGVAITPDEKEVYVANFNDGTVSVIDTATYTVKATLYVGSGPVGVAVTPDDKMVYVACRDSNYITAIDTATNTVITKVNVGSMPVAFGQSIVPYNPPILPVADFNSNVTSGFAPLTVQFTDLSTNATSLYWDFGDGASSTDRYPVHTYPSEGNYIVNLTASNGNSVNIKTTMITVYPPVPMTYPVANFSSNVTEGYAPLSVQFTDLSANAISWNWNFGDGTNSTQQSPIHVFSAAGNYTVNLTVNNENGSSSKIGILNVTNLPVFPSCSKPPTDLNNDGLYEDINGNLRIDFKDVVAYYNNMDWISQNGVVAFFDYNHNGRIDFKDVVKLYNMI